MSTSKPLRFRRIATLVLGGGVFALLALAATGAAIRPAALALEPPDCATLEPIAPAGTTVWVAPSAGVSQPLDPGTRIAACSLGLATITYTSARLSVYHWDPQALAPDPTTIALRTREFTPSSLVYGRTRANFWPPVVTAAVAQVADAPQGPIAFDWRVTDPFNGQNVRYEATASPSLPVAYLYGSSGTRVPIGGDHPGLNLMTCDGGAPYGNVRVAQAVMRTDRLDTYPVYAFAQRFRVPERTELGWVEFALGVDSYNLTAGNLAIHDGEGSPSPPPASEVPLVEAAFQQYYFNSPTWGTHFDFDHSITLQPDHDYWLVIRTNNDYPLYSRVLDGSESADFTAHIGPLHRRLLSGDPWTLVTGEALDFRILGVPSSVTDVALPRARRGGLALEVTPNPARGSAAVRWSGAKDGVRLEVLDPRGRRVADAGFAAGAAGSWTWSGLDGRGAALPAGVYFVRATDAERSAAVRRLVRVR